MSKFRRHKKEWFINRVGQVIRWQVPSGGKLSAVQKMPNQMMIANEQHANALYVFHNDNKINFQEAE